MQITTLLLIVVSTLFVVTIGVLLYVGNMYRSRRMIKLNRIYKRLSNEHKQRLNQFLDRSEEELEAFVMTLEQRHDMSIKFHNKRIDELESTANKLADKLSNNLKETDRKIMLARNEGKEEAMNEARKEIENAEHTIREAYDYMKKLRRLSNSLIETALNMKKEMANIETTKSKIELFQHYALKGVQELHIVGQEIEGINKRINKIQTNINDISDGPLYEEPKVLAKVK